MRYLIRHRGRDLAVTATNPDATVGDLTAALDPILGAGPLWIGERPVGAATPLDRAGILDGDVVSTEPPPPPTTSTPPASIRLTFTTGAQSGHVVELPPGLHEIGRRPGQLGQPGHVIAEPTMSARHARIEVGQGDNPTLTVVDLGSSNGTDVEGAPAPAEVIVAAGTPRRLRLGNARAVISNGPPAPDSPALPRHGSRPTVPHHRPVRPPLAPAPEPVPLPDPPKEPSTTPPSLGIAALGVTSVGALAMVVILGSWRYAAFALVGPLTMVAHHLDGRRRGRRTRRSESRRLSRDLERLTLDLEFAAAQERNRRTRLHADAVTDRSAATIETLWERRPDHEDFGLVRIGHGTGPWTPGVQGERVGVDPAVEELLARHRSLSDTSLGLALRPGEPVAVLGPAEAARGLTRTIIVNATGAHGPADLGVVALWDPRQGDWNWLAWLPHAYRSGDVALLAVDPQTGRSVADQITSPPPGSPALTVVVLDDPTDLADRRGVSRHILRQAGDPANALVPVVIIPAGTAVPAACTTVLTVSADGTLEGPPSVTAGFSVAAMTPVEVAREHARALARFEDPEASGDARDLPSTVAFHALSGTTHESAGTVAARWAAGGEDPAPRTTIGVWAEGPLTVDLALDGPHLLVAGTTGSGKSELLRTMVLGLAASCSPDHLAFVLVDFKGGAAFDACSQLPHTTGVVTDLDDRLAARALVCLDAEIRHRERRLREAEASDLTELRRLDPGGPPMPRLVVMVDEFAALGRSVPDFVDSLVDIAQRGRSLGIHLVLATQRPAGAVSQAIQANMGARLCLRVASGQDSVDVIGTDAASLLPRQFPGRALVSFGPGELITAQIATTAQPAATGSVDLVPLGPAAGRARGCAAERSGPRALDPGRRVPGVPGEVSALATTVGYMVEAWEAAGGARPRCPWPDPLPEEVTWPVDDGPEGSQHLTLGLADEPSAQRTTPFSWDVGRGPLLALGLAGSGTALLAGTAAVEAARRWHDTGPVIGVIDGGPGELEVLAGLPAVGAVVKGHELERQRRLVESVADELAARQSRQATAGTPHLLVIHGLAALRPRWEEAGDVSSWSRLLEIAKSGAESGVYLCLTAEGSVPHSLVALCEQRLILRLGDANEAAAYGVPARSIPPPLHGRGIAVQGGMCREVQVARPADGLAGAVAELASWTNGPDSPTWVGVLPRSVDVSDLDAASARTGGAGLSLRLGLADQGLETATLRLVPGAHAVVAGPARSGRTTALIRLAQEAAPVLPVVWVAGAGAPLAVPGCRIDFVGADDPDLEDRLVDLSSGLVLVDDADRIGDHPVLAELLTERRPGVHVVVAGRNDRLRSNYGHWTREARADGTGLLLCPDLDLDGDLLGVRLPRRPLVDMVAGRGWLDGPDQSVTGFVQVAVSRTP
ncbi:MAG: FHA domain-containing protein [Microthrixaceae bacterium]|nr:FHA domain-containing protein [Acidimicrobiales bacterium]MCB9402802.1 FHA domain-containing protein [Microthrixaceae bacterium]